MIALPFYFGANIIGYHLNLGILGIAIAETLQQFIHALVNTIKLKTKDGVKEYFAFTDFGKKYPMKDYMRLAVASTIMFYLDSWVFNASILIASYLSVAENAAQTILRNIAIIFFIYGASISFTVTALVGGAVGKGDDVLARKIH